MSKKINIYETIEKLEMNNNGYVQAVADSDDVIVRVNDMGNCYNINVEYDDELDDYDEQFKRAVEGALEHDRIYVARYLDDETCSDFGFIIDKDLNFTLAQRFYGSFSSGQYCEIIMDVTKFINDPTLIAKVDDLIKCIIYD